MTTTKVPIKDLESWIEANPKIASKVVELIEQGKSRTEILNWLQDEYHSWRDAPVLPNWLLSDDEYLNDFHKSWNEACIKENESKRSTHFSAEFLRAQSRRLESAVWLDEEREGRKRRK